MFALGKYDDALNPACYCADVFQSVELPETIEEFLDDGVAQCIAFNRRGTLLAGDTSWPLQCMQLSCYTTSALQYCSWLC